MDNFYERASVKDRLTSFTNPYTNTDMSKLRLTCRVCYKTYANLSTLRRHMWNLHEKNAKGYKCPICHKRLNRRDTYLKHARNIHGYGDLCPEPILEAYDPKDLATKPIVKRRWEVTPKTPGNTVIHPNPKFRIVPARPFVSTKSNSDKKSSKY